jgi:prephenate dehydrogenase
MGDIIKIEYGRLNNLTYGEIEANKSNYRQGLIDLGNWGRKQSPDFWLEKIIAQDGNIVITDVTDIKSEIVYKIQTILRKDIEFIPAHPMSGREVYGVENNDPDMFKGANYIITPTSENTLSAIELAKMIGQELEFRNIAVLTPEEHDEMIGFLSQLTHCIAVSLMTCKDSTHLVEYTGDSFRDLTRIAKINENMWTELFLMNKNQLLAQMDLFLTEFKKLRDALAKEDQESMKEMMRLSTKRRKYFD